MHGTGEMDQLHFVLAPGNDNSDVSLELVEMRKAYNRAGKIPSRQLKLVTETSVSLLKPGTTGLSLLNQAFLARGGTWERVRGGRKGKRTDALYPHPELREPVRYLKPWLSCE